MDKRKRSQEQRTLENSIRIYGAVCAATGMAIGFLLKGFLS